MNRLYTETRKRLEESGMEQGEARAIALLLMEKVCGLSVAEVLSGKETEEKGGERREATQLEEATSRVAAGEPVQYVLGEAEFCGMTLHVEPGVLIPRQETEELVAWIKEEASTPAKALDIGTGCGCIAIALAKALPEATIEAWDISQDALRIARMNAERWGANVRLRQVDVLAQKVPYAATPSQQTQPEKGEEQAEGENLFDIIVSNPPYVCEEEAGEMERNVLEHEPRLALFVPDDDPLLFYRRIATLGLRLLKKGGLLFFEINRRFGKETTEMLEEMGYKEVALRQDMAGNDRMVKAIKR